jgi:hypothetical protein
VVNLVFWSLVFAMTPVALGSAWRLVSGTLRWIALGFSRAFADSQTWGPSA